MTQPNDSEHPSVDFTPDQAPGAIGGSAPEPQAQPETVAQPEAPQTEAPEEKPAERTKVQGVWTTEEEDGQVRTRLVLANGLAVNCLRDTEAEGRQQLIDFLAERGIDAQ